MISILGTLPKRLLAHHVFIPIKYLIFMGVARLTNVNEWVTVLTSLDVIALALGKQSDKRHWNHCINVSDHFWERKPDCLTI